MHKVVVWLLSGVVGGATIGCGPAETPKAAAIVNVVAVVATVTDLASLAREVGGTHVAVECLVPAEGDPHELEVRASDVARMARARLVLLVGHGTEAGWLPALLEGSRNAHVAVDADGYLDLGAGANAIAEGPVGDGADHGHSHHPDTNPHYLLDPIEGLRVAGEIAARLEAIDPTHTEHYRSRLADFTSRLCRRLAGDDAVATLGSTHVAELVQAGTLEAELAKSGKAVGGWLAAMRPASLRPVVGDHDHWPYFARRFGVAIVGHFESEPGVDPTPRHLEKLIETITKAGVRELWVSPFFDPRHTEAIVGRTLARAVPLAHQTQALPGAIDYIGLFDTNVRTIAAAADAAAKTSGR